jgi:ribosomal protein L44E
MREYERSTREYEGTTKGVQGSTRKYGKYESLAFSSLDCHQTILINEEKKKKIIFDKNILFDVIQLFL